MESKLVEQMLNEATYNWDIDPLDRSWFITVDGKLWGDLSHRFLLKNKFKSKWEALKQRGVSDKEIEETFTKNV